MMLISGNLQTSQSVPVQTDPRSTYFVDGTTTYIFMDDIPHSNKIHHHNVRIYGHKQLLWSCGGGKGELR